MNTKASATIKIKQWDEKLFHEQEGGGKLTRTSVVKSYEGDLAGDGTLEYLMAYGLDGVATFVGMERIAGTLGGRSGSFVIVINGKFVDGAPKESFTILAGSGTGALAGLSGSGGLGAGPNETYVMDLDYNFTN